MSHKHLLAGAICDSGKRTWDIPEIFCWTKMGVEAGQTLEAILRRKELERRAGGGVFAWGIGNSLGMSANLARRRSPSGEVDVLFTPMKSAPKMADAAPSQLLLWLGYQTRSGRPARLPEHVVVTSRGGPGKRSHYALLCQADDELRLGAAQIGFDAADVRNLASLNPVGASQVTAVVKHEGQPTFGGKGYNVAFRAKLIAEGFIRLVVPVIMDSEMMNLYREACRADTEETWRNQVRVLRQLAEDRATEAPDQQDLFS